MMKLWAILCGKGCRNTAVLWLILFGFVSILKADPVDVEKARAVALTQLRKVTRDNVGLRSATSLDLVYEPKNEANHPYFYVFNGGKGFVIVSGDDRATPILGYSDEGSFDPDNIPPNMVEFLKGYEKEIDFVIRNSQVKNVDLETEWQNLRSGNIEILQTQSKKKVKYSSHSLSQRSYAVGDYLIKTKWGQGSNVHPYYNALCPYDPVAGKRTVVGCVATAMAQIIRYWGTDKGIAPTHGYGSVGSVNFGTTHYDYDNMPVAINGTSPEVQKNAVALLSYHCGVASRMSYGTVSSTTTLNATFAFNDHFGYSNAQYNGDRAVIRFSLSELIDVFMSNLDKGQPVLYSVGTHAFICDGYNMNGEFHMNWGWDGIDDGWYSLTALRPAEVGGNYSYHESRFSVVYDIYPVRDARSPKNENVIYVTPEGTGTKDGSSWSNATPDLYSEMMKDRTDTIQIWVKEGVYYGDTILSQGVNAAFILGKRNRIYGGFAGNEVSLEARAGNNPSVLDGLNSRRVVCQLTDFVNADSTILDGFTIRNGQDTLAGSSNINGPIVNGNDMTGNGGGVYLKANGILKNCVIENCKAKSGGGVFNNGGKIIDCSFYDNMADNAGGFFNNGTAILNDSHILRNEAVHQLGYGGGIHNRGNLYINENTIIEYNEGGIGGGLYNAGSVIMNGGDIIYNMGKSIGGGIYNDMNVVIHDGNISYNENSGIVSHGSLTLYGGIISNNRTNGSGGGINCNNGTLNISGASVKITKNTAQTGGGIYLGGGIATISAGQIGVMTNTAPENAEEALEMGGNCAGSGAGIFVRGSNNQQLIFSSVGVGEVIIGGNYASGFGGGISAGISTNLPENVIICGNTASSGGGFYTPYSNTSHSFTGCNVLNNKATGYGGGIYNAANLYVYDGEFSGNKANIGDGIYNYSTFSLSGNVNMSDIIYIAHSSANISLSQLPYHVNNTIPLVIQGTPGTRVLWSSNTLLQEYINNGILTSTPGYYLYVSGNYAYLYNGGPRSVEQSATVNDPIGSEKISVYPTLINSGGTLTIVSSGGGTASVWNLSGMMVGQYKLVEGKTQISISCPAGNYVVKVKTDTGEEKVMKIIVK